MAEPFSLDELIPELLTVRLAGQVYEVRMVAHLGPAEYALFNRLHTQVATALVKFHSGTEDEQIVAGEDLASATDRLIHILIPDMAVDAIAGMSFAKKSAFIDYWRSKQPAADATPGKVAGKRQTLPQRLPA